MAIHKKFLQADSAELSELEKRYDYLPQAGSINVPLTSLNQMCYDRMREITRRHLQHKNVSKLEQTLRAYRDYAVKQL